MTEDMPTRVKRLHKSLEVWIRAARENKYQWWQIRQALEGQVAIVERIERAPRRRNYHEVIRPKKP